MFVLDVRTAVYVEDTVAEGDGIKAWQALIELFERKDLLMANLRNELGHTHLEEGGDIEEFLAKIHHLVRQIQAGEGNDGLQLYQLF